MVGVAWPYRLFFLWVEPISALLGSYYSFMMPQTYLHLTHASSAPLLDLPIATHIALNQLANLYLFFAMNEAFVLRATSDIRVWRTLLFSLLVADLGHLYSVNPLGRRIYSDVFHWNAIDWGNIGFVYLGALMRTTFLLGVGITGSSR